MHENLTIGPTKYRIPWKHERQHLLARISQTSFSEIGGAHTTKWRRWEEPVETSPRNHRPVFAPSLLSRKLPCEYIERYVFSCVIYGSLLPRLQYATTQLLMEISRRKLSMPSPFFSDRISPSMYSPRRATSGGGGCVKALEHAIRTETIKYYATRLPRARFLRNKNDQQVFIATAQGSTAYLPGQQHRLFFTEPNRGV